MSPLVNGALALNAPSNLPAASARLSFECLLYSKEGILPCILCRCEEWYARSRLKEDHSADSSSRQWCTRHLTMWLGNKTILLCFASLSDVITCPILFSDVRVQDEAGWEQADHVFLRSGQSVLGHQRDELGHCQSHSDVQQRLLHLRRCPIPG